MNILLISQCDKNALKETRRIIDQFAERRGDRVWQTPITQRGLDTLRRLLKKTARKNTAVACHWIRAKNHSELMWIVGSASRFNERGAVPTNCTTRDVLRARDENDWHCAEEIRLLAALAALFHDLGKANRAFQEKLNSRKPIADAFRHEWVSLRILQAFVGDDDDRGWLSRLAQLPGDVNMVWLRNLKKDFQLSDKSSPFKKPLPPLARLVGWLIVSHHRMPTRNRGVEGDTPPVNPNELVHLPRAIHAGWCGSRLSEAGPRDDFTNQEKQVITANWDVCPDLLFCSKAWQKRVAKHASRILENKVLLEDNWLAKKDPYVLHLSRLALMLADHHYSSLSDVTRRVSGDPDYPIIANTNRETGKPNQKLDEHLIGVEIETASIVHSLSLLDRKLPRIARHKGFRQRSADPRFRWQDEAFDLAASLRLQTSTQGFFGINMASTGKGKTLANGRIMYALASPEIGARFSIALGLRTLTLQTGDAYRQRLGLGADDLAVLVGGRSVRELHEHGRLQQAAESLESKYGGSESAEDLLGEGSHVHYEGNLETGPLREWIAHTRGAQQLLSAPILACTIDHLVQATESLRGGRQIAPMLRLMTSDLVLDEPDDFGIGDLPALARLVNWAGMLGSRVLLSSATLPPSLVQGLFEAYLRGRELYQVNRGLPGAPLEPCVAWFDEFGCQRGDHGSADTFVEQHGRWTARRSEALAKETEQRRIAQIVTVTRPEEKTDEAIAASLAGDFLPRMHELHAAHHSVDPKSGKKVSFGLVRMANIGPLFDVTRAIAQQGAQPNHRLHIVCYHSQHPLLVRSQIEGRLDNMLDRNDANRVFADREMRTTLTKQEEQNHIFVVLATAVAEVGRDHDYDWAIVEPSSMRSIVQLAGRVRRHREGRVSSPNLCLLETNVRHLKGESPAYCRPGFEEGSFKLETHDLNELLSREQLERIDSTPRIIERPSSEPTKNLVDLEHAHLRALMLEDPTPKKGNPPPKKVGVHYWWRSAAHLSGELQREQRFRHDPQGRVAYALQFDADSESVIFVRIEHDGQVTPSGNLLHAVDLAEQLAPSVDLWGGSNYHQQVAELASELNVEPDECARRYGTLELPERGAEQGWDYQPSLGFRRHK